MNPIYIYIYLEPQTTIYKWLFQLDDSQSLHRKWLFHQTCIFNWLFGVPGIYILYAHIHLNLKEVFKVEETIFPPDSGEEEVGPLFSEKWIFEPPACNFEPQKFQKFPGSKKQKNVE